MQKKWAEGADRIAPTLVGGSKKHGGPDLGPTRAKMHGQSLALTERELQMRHRNRILTGCHV